LGAEVGHPQDREPDEDGDDAPETPLDERRPPRVEDPPSQPDPKGPYVVQQGKRAGTAPRAQEKGGGAVSAGERKKRRGFASMSADKQREIASKGGRAAHDKGTAHEWTADEARNAGRKGGQVSRAGRGRLAIPDVQPPNSTPDTPLAGPTSTVSRAE
jgi:uncharacterized protein